MPEDTTEVQSREIGKLKTDVGGLYNDMSAIRKSLEEALADRPNGEESAPHSEQIDKVLEKVHACEDKIEKLQTQESANRIVRTDEDGFRKNERWHPIRPECRAEHAQNFENAIYDFMVGKTTKDGMRAGLIQKQNDMLRKPDEVKTLTATTLTEGGALIPEEYINDIIIRSGVVSPVRALVQTRQTTGIDFHFPRMKFATTMTRTGELGTMSTTTQPIFEMISGSVGKAYARVPLTREMISDSAFNIKQLVTDDVGQAHGLLIGSEFVQVTEQLDV